MANKKGCSVLSFIPSLDLMFLRKDFAPQTPAGVDWLVHTQKHHTQQRKVPVRLLNAEQHSQAQIFTM